MAIYMKNEKNCFSSLLNYFPTIILILKFNSHHILDSPWGFGVLGSPKPQNPLKQIDLES